MAIGVVETFVGIHLYQKGDAADVPTGDKQAAQRKRRLIQVGLMVSISGLLMVIAGIAVQRLL